MPRHTGLTFDLPPLRTSEIGNPGVSSPMGTIGGQTAHPSSASIDFGVALPPTGNAPSPAPETPTGPGQLERVLMGIEAAGASFAGEEPLYMKLAKQRMEKDQLEIQKLTAAHTVMSSTLDKWPLLDASERVAMLQTASPLLQKLGIKNAPEIFKSIGSDPSTALAFSDAIDGLVKGDTQEAKGLQAILQTVPKAQWGAKILELSKDKDFQVHVNQKVAARVGAKLPSVLAGLDPAKQSALEQGSLSQAELVKEAAQLKDANGKPVFDRHELFAIGDSSNQTMNDLLAGNKIITSESLRKAQEKKLEAEATEASKIKVAAAGKATTNINMAPQEKEEQKAVGKAFGEQYTDIQKTATQAGTTISKLARMENLLNGIETGKLTPAVTEVQALAQSLGISVDIKDLSAKQALEALSNEIALTFRNPAGGAGMPGQLSDKDREFLVSMTPGLSKIKEGNKLIIETARKLAQRQQEVAAQARAYRKKNGQMDEGFYDALQEYSNKHPLFEQQKKKIGTVPLSPEEKAELEHLRKKRSSKP